MFFIDKGECGEAVLHKGHNVAVIFDAIVSSDIVKTVRTAVAAARVAVNDSITLRSPALHFMKIHVPKGALGTAVDMEDRWVLFSLLESDRLHVPSVELPAIIFKLSIFGYRKNTLLAKKVIVVRQLLFVPVLADQIKLLEIQLSKSGNSSLS